jgi:hypothetical protein
VQTVSDVQTVNANLNLYELKADLYDDIAAYMAGTESSKYYHKMVPYTAVEYYGDFAGKFDSDGVGYGDWEKIYLCNGYNGMTPDKRGRIPVGTTQDIQYQ